MPNDQRFIDPSDIETLELEWGTIKWLSTPETTGAEAFSSGVVVLTPGEGHERHTHPDSEEVLYFLNGEGVQTIGDEEREVTPGDMVYIPAGVEHSTENTGWEPMRFLAMYGPPGPEAEIRDAPGCEVRPPEGRDI
ncbi:cupin domain-containing protein [Halorubrum lipolyticum]|uniref:Cupin n=1 Tax=Halorubrum lipolyticum DSM 21995 TaxID=1227482 RepID=M0NR13_9EURY|nr:cupin domain-containing protein [Halorubrum lipolyticum]EMA59654.1 cupin [Halorubrum lipolyticum DSM 21995]